jgi:hypothetical protein
MSIMIKKCSIIVKSYNIAHVVNVGAYVDFNMLINIINTTRINYRIWHAWL